MVEVAGEEGRGAMGERGEEVEEGEEEEEEVEEEEVEEEEVVAAGTASRRRRPAAPARAWSPAWGSVPAVLGRGSMGPALSPVTSAAKLVTSKVTSVTSNNRHVVCHV